MSPNGENARKLYETDEKSSICCVNWSADGQRIVYVRTDQAGGTFLSRDLKGGPISTILTPPVTKTVGDFLWLPDGRFLYSVEEPDSYLGTSLTSGHCGLIRTRVNRSDIRSSLRSGPSPSE